MKRLVGISIVALMVGLLVGLCLTTVSADPLPGRRIQTPSIKVGDGWETLVQIQNPGGKTGVVVLFWGSYSAKCPSNDPGPIGHACMSLAPGGIWTLKGGIPQEAKSALIYSVAHTKYATACDGAGEVGSYSEWRDWETQYEGTGEALAVVVDRQGPNAFGTTVSSEYTGISEEMEGEGPPYHYSTAYVMKGYHNLDTVMYIQNSGRECVSVWLYYRDLETFRVLYAQHVEMLAPGETVTTTVPSALPCGFLGSATIESGQPLGIIVDQTSLKEPCGSTDREMLLTSRGHPCEGEGDRVVYADLLFRELSGWNTGIQVHNQGNIQTFVSVDFRDAGGGEVYYLADWIPAHTANTFYLPAVTDLGSNYAGSARIESHDQVAFPGEMIDGQPIFAVVDLKKPSTGQGGAYNAHGESQIRGVETFVLPLVSNGHQGVTSQIAVHNTSNCNRVKIKLHFESEGGTTPCQFKPSWLEPEQVRLINLKNVGCLTPGWTGGAEVKVDEVEWLCGDEPIKISVVVVNEGQNNGDLTRIYEGFPYP